MSPRVAVLFRGYHAYDRMPPDRKALTQQPKAFDFRDPWPNIERMVLAPLRAQAKSIDIFVSTYISDPDTQAALEALLCPRACLFHAHAQGLTQTDIVANGLRLVADACNGVSSYDAVYVLRFDVVYKTPVMEWCTGTGMGMWLPFKDVFDPMVGDIVMVVRGSLYMLLKVCHIVQHMAKKKLISFHDFRGYLDTMHIPMAFICEGHYDSNTSKQIPQSCNPLYVLYGRPYHFDDAPTECK